jgi:hypothetical protein
MQVKSSVVHNVRVEILAKAGHAQGPQGKHPQ